MEQANPRTPARAFEWPDLLWPLGIFVALVGFKLVFVTWPTLGATISDEDVYWRLSRILFDGVFYQGTKYPPLWPAAIAPAHLFGEHAYRAALVLAALYSSATVLPVYALARHIARRPYAVAATLLCALLPYHYVLPRTLMSENLYFPLFMMCVWMVIYRPKRHAAVFDLGTGVAIGALYLTRYVTLAALPAFAVAWWLREWERAGRWTLDRAAWGRLVAVVMGFVAVFGPWVWIERGYGLAIRTTLGFGVASNSDPAQLTLERLSWYARMYAAYFVLIAAPLFGLMMLAPVQVWKERALNAYTRFFWLTVLLSGGLWAAMSRHSWRAAYNYPEPLRIMGRYAIYFGALYIVLALLTLAGWERIERVARPGALTHVAFKQAALTLLLPVALVVVSYLTVLGDWVLPITERMITDRGAVDAYRIQLMGAWFWVIALGALAAVSASMWWTRRDTASRNLPGAAARLPAARNVALWATSLGTAAFLLVGAPAYSRQIQAHQRYVVHAHHVLDVALGLGVELPVDVHVSGAVSDSTGFPAVIVQSGMRLNVRFPERHHVRVYVEPGADAPPAHIELLTTEEAEDDATVLDRYEVDGTGEFVIVESEGDVR